MRHYNSNVSNAASRRGSDTVARPPTATACVLSDKELSDHCSAGMNNPSETLPRHSLDRRLSPGVSAGTAGLCTPE